MDGKLHLIMPMAGRGSRFKSDGFDIPKPLINIYDKPFFYWAARSVEKFVDVASIDFIVLQEHIDRYGIDKEVRTEFPEARVHALPEVTEGAVITCMKGIEEISDELPVVFNDCDHLFRCSKFYSFCNETPQDATDGLLLTFTADEPKYSFIQKNDQGDVIRTVEKKVISDEAICGCYYFKSKDIFMRCAQQYLKECNYSEYYMSGVYNVMIEKGKTVRSLKTDVHVSFGVPEEYESAKCDTNYRELL